MCIVHFDKKVFNNNIARLKEWAKKRKIDLSFMIKWQLLQLPYIRKEVELSGVRTYTTKSGISDHALNLYYSENLIIVDAFDKREGIELKDIKKIPDRHKKKAIVNFYCCNKKIPTFEDIERISKLLGKEFREVSLGGSMLLWYDNNEYNEIRVGECLLTGYSTVFNCFFDRLENPFKIEVPIEISRYGRVLVKKGFLSFGGFTNSKPLAINTDLSVFSEKDIEWSPKIGYIVLRPDYYTLIKMAHNGELNKIVEVE